MKKLARNALLAAVGLAALLAVVVNLMAEPISDAAAPDPSTPITLPSGRIATLEEVIQRTEEARAAPARAEMTEGRLLRSIPEAHPDWAVAQRHIGWKIYACELDEPQRGVAYVHRAVREEPLSGNAWQDLYRIYFDSVGLR